MTYCQRGRYLLLRERFSDEIIISLVSLVYHPPLEADKLTHVE